MMNNNHILLASPFFYPEAISTGKYNTYLAKAFVARGDLVSVICSYPIYPDWHPHKVDDSIIGMNIYRGGSWLRYPNSTLIRRAILESWYACYSLYQYFRLKSKPTHIVAVFPPSLFFMLWTIFLPKKIKKIGIVHDLQGVYASQSKGLLGRFISLAIHTVESKCFKSCDNIIFLSESMQQKAMDEYALDDQTCDVCYPFVALPEQPLSQGTALQKIFNEQNTHLVYSGALGEKQNPDGLVAFFHKASQEKSNLCCHIFSAGPVFERLSILHKDDSSIHFHDLVPLDQLTELYARSDIQIIPQAMGTSEGSLPSKLPNLLATGVPIFVVCDEESELGKLVNEAHAGCVSHSWNEKDLMTALTPMLSMLKTGVRASRRERLQSFVKAKFSLSHVVDKILDK